LKRRRADHSQRIRHKHHKVFVLLNGAAMQTRAACTAEGTPLHVAEVGCRERSDAAKNIIGAGTSPELITLGALEE
jgi:hypothetical protein